MPTLVDHPYLSTPSERHLPALRAFLLRLHRRPPRLARPSQLRPRMHFLPQATRPGDRGGLAERGQLTERRQG